MAKPGQPLTVELEAAAVRALCALYGDLNDALFRRSLRPPMILLSDAEGHLGRWEHRLRTLEISRKTLLQHGWGGVTEVLKHEMAHQYVDEVLGCHDETAHGPTFQRVCEE